MSESSGPVPAPVIDWLHPPEGVAERSLAGQLQYAAVLAFQSDRLKRTLLIELLPYVEEGAQPEPTLLFALRDVASTRALAHELWPGGLVIPPDASPEERDQIVGEFKEKCTEVSVDWSACESALGSGGFAVIDAEWIGGQAGLALRLDVVDGKTRGYTLLVRCKGLDVTSADGTPLRLEGLSS
jgi:hypothetical protein